MACGGDCGCSDCGAERRVVVACETQAACLAPEGLRSSAPAHPTGGVRPQDRSGPSRVRSRRPVVLAAQAGALAPPQMRVEGAPSQDHAALDALFAAVRESGAPTAPASRPEEQVGAAPASAESAPATPRSPSRDVVGGGARAAVLRPPGLPSPPELLKGGRGKQGPKMGYLPPVPAPPAPPNFPLLGNPLGAPGQPALAAPDPACPGACVCACEPAALVPKSASPAPEPPAVPPGQTTASALWPAVDHGMAEDEAGRLVAAPPQVVAQESGRELAGPSHGLQFVPEAAGRIAAAEALSEPAAALDIAGLPAAPTPSQARGPSSARLHAVDGRSQLNSMAAPVVQTVQPAVVQQVVAVSRSPRGAGAAPRGFAAPGPFESDEEEGPDAHGPGSAAPLQGPRLLGRTGRGPRDAYDAAREETLRDLGGGPALVGPPDDAYQRARMEAARDQASGPQLLGPDSDAAKRAREETRRDDAGRPKAVTKQEAQAAADAAKAAKGKADDSGGGGNAKGMSSPLGDVPVAQARPVAPPDAADARGAARPLRPLAPGDAVRPGMAASQGASVPLRPVGSLPGPGVASSDPGGYAARMQVLAPSDHPSYAAAQALLSAMGPGLEKSKARAPLAGEEIPEAARARRQRAPVVEEPGPQAPARSATTPAGVALSAQGAVAFRSVYAAFPVEPPGTAPGGAVGPRVEQASEVPRAAPATGRMEPLEPPQHGWGPLTAGAGGVRRPPGPWRPAGAGPTERGPYALGPRLQPAGTRGDLGRALPSSVSLRELLSIHPDGWLATQHDLPGGVAGSRGAASSAAGPAAAGGPAVAAGERARSRETGARLAEQAALRAVLAGEAEEASGPAELQTRDLLDAARSLQAELEARRNALKDEGLAPAAVSADAEVARLARDLAEANRRVPQGAESHRDVLKAARRERRLADAEAQAAEALAPGSTRGGRGPRRALPLTQTADRLASLELRGLRAADAERSRHRADVPPADRDAWDAAQDLAEAEADRLIDRRLHARASLATSLAAQIAELRAEAADPGTSGQDQAWLAKRIQALTSLLARLKPSAAERRLLAKLQSRESARQRRAARRALRAERRRRQRMRVPARPTPQGPWGPPPPAHGFILGGAGATPFRPPPGIGFPPVPGGPSGPAITPPDGPATDQKHPSPAGGELDCSPCRCDRPCPPGEVCRCRPRAVAASPQGPAGSGAPATKAGSGGPPPPPVVTPPGGGGGSGAARPGGGLDVPALAPEGSGVNVEDTREYAFADEGPETDGGAFRSRLQGPRGREGRERETATVARDLRGPCAHPPPDTTWELRMTSAQTYLTQMGALKDALERAIAGSSAARNGRLNHLRSMALHLESRAQALLSTYRDFAAGRLDWMGEDCAELLDRTEGNLDMLEDRVALLGIALALNAEVDGHAEPDVLTVLKILGLLTFLGNLAAVTDSLALTSLSEGAQELFRILSSRIASEDPAQTEAWLRSEVERLSSRHRALSALAGIIGLLEIGKGGFRSGRKLGGARGATPGERALGRRLRQQRTIRPGAGQGGQALHPDGTGGGAPGRPSAAQGRPGVPETRSVAPPGAAEPQGSAAPAPSRPVPVPSPAPAGGAPAGRTVAPEATPVQGPAAPARLVPESAPRVPGARGSPEPTPGAPAPRSAEAPPGARQPAPEGVGAAPQEAPSALRPGEAEGPTGVNLGKRPGNRSGVAPGSRRTPHDWTPDEAASRVDELKVQGHGPQKHEGQVGKAQHDERVLRGADPETGAVEVWRGGPKAGQPKIPPKSSSFKSNEAYAQAEAKAREHPDFTRGASEAKPEIKVKDLSLRDALGDDYLKHVEGRTTIGSAPGSTRATDFSGGTVTAIYRRNASGGYDLVTMYPDGR